MKVDPRALAGIESKITRADQHFRLLDDEMTAWDTSRPWRLVPEVHDQGRKHFYRLRFIRPIPVDWAVVLGEAVHDLRSALDQCVYWLSIDWTRREQPFCSFPVYTSKALFYERDKKGNVTRRSGMNKIRGIGPGPQTFIEALQPYPQRYRRFYCREVRTIHDFWNQDKHRLVHLWGLRFSDEEVRLQQHVAQDCVVGIYRRVLHEGAIVLNIACGSPRTDAEMKMDGKISASLTVYGGKHRGGPPSLSLWDMQRTVVDVIRKLTNAIGRQSDPISLTTWTAKNQLGCTLHLGPKDQ